MLITEILENTNKQKLTNKNHSQSHNWEKTISFWNTYPVLIFMQTPSMFFPNMGSCALLFYNLYYNFTYEMIC